MITLEIYYPLLDGRYDFVVDEFLSIESIVDDLVQMISIYNRLTLDDKEHAFSLYSKEKNCLFSPHNCLYDYGVKTGDKLYIV